MTLDSNLQAFATRVGQDMKAVAAAQVTLARAVPGTVLRCPWNGTAWTYSGVAISARPSARADIYFELIGAPPAIASPSWMLNGDSRTDVKWPATEVAVYLPIWASNPDSASVDDVPTDADQVRIGFAYGTPMQLIGWGRDGQAATVSKLKAMRAAGKQVVLSVGGDGYPVDLSNPQARASELASIARTLGGIDAWDYDWEAGVKPTQAQVVEFAVAVHAATGAGATVVPPGSDVEHYLGIAVELEQRGILLSYGQQFYSSDVTYGGVQYRVNEAIAAGIPAARIGVGMMIDPGAVGWTVAECTQIMQSARAEWGLRRAYLWEANRPEAAAWATAIRGVVQ